MKHHVCAVILAAGKASRMGKMKQLLPLGHQTILEHVIGRALNEDFSAVYVVVGYNEALIREQIKRRDERLHWIINPAYEDGQSTSLKVAFEQLKAKYDHMVLFLGDMPCIQSKTINYIYEESIKKAINDEEPFILRPTCNGINGHPVFIGNFFHDVFMQVEGDSGLRQIVNQLSNCFTREVNDVGVMLDVDTIEQYEQMKEFYENRYKKA